MALLRWSMSRLSAPVYTRVFSARYSSDKREIASVKDQGTGLERKEVDAIYEQIEDPFNMKIPEGPGGTRGKPTLVPSMFEERIVGCICERNHHGHQWFLLKMGPAQRCLCGHYFQLVEGSSTHVYEESAH
ncbi:cytochrome c oxidase subunit 5B, mitochondrial-like [Dysidea avara]|uniref:cytochrome c oxidase subunit 5B, mitochondrial-like n=1 Tax=Dysidea avara TaxID=196820 RepID=UPI00331CE6BD